MKGTFVLLQGGVYVYVTEVNTQTTFIGHNLSKPKLDKEEFDTEKITNLNPSIEDVRVYSEKRKKFYKECPNKNIILGKINQGIAKNIKKALRASKVKKTEGVSEACPA